MGKTWSGAIVVRVSLGRRFVVCARVCGFCVCNNMWFSNYVKSQYQYQYLIVLILMFKRTNVIVGEGDLKILKQYPKSLTKKISQNGETSSGAVRYLIYS